VRDVLFYRTPISKSESFSVKREKKLALPGLTQEQVAERLSTKKSAISRIENSAGSVRLSTLERYARAIGWHLTLDLQPPRKSASPSK
jgi:transcriptional regulator with XRE-family HTH domain